LSLYERWSRFVDGASQHRCLIGASVFRIVAGFTILYQYLINYGQRRFLFGPDGVLPYQGFLAEMAATGNVSLYALGDSLAVFELLYHAGIVICFAWTIGIKSRWLTPVSCMLWISLQSRFSYLWDGGDNLMAILLVYACFADLGAHLSLDSGRHRRAARQAGALGLLHNAAMLAIGLQVCLVYGVAGLTKVQGETWQNGTALYYAMRAPEYRWPGVSELVFENAALVVVFSYATVAFQIAFPFLIFMNRRTRAVAVSIGICFHVAIGWVMGLVTFALFMIAADLSLVGDEEYRRFARWIRRHSARIWPRACTRTI
jgi:hypothetical protein